MKRSRGIAAAIALIVAITGVLFCLVIGTGGASTAYAEFSEIVEPILTARTATFTIAMTFQDRPIQSGKGMFMAPARLRLEIVLTPVVSKAPPNDRLAEDSQPPRMSPDATVIADMQKGRIVVLMPKTKKAQVMTMVNAQEGDSADRNLFLLLRRRILEAKGADDKSVEFLGEKEIDGVRAIGYHVRKPEVDITVWANSKTKLPVQLAMATGPETTTMSNFVFDSDLDESLFSQQIPEGYTVTTTEVDVSEPEEKDLLNMLRTWAERMGGGFPSVMDRSALAEFMTYQKKMLKGKGDEAIEQHVQESQGVIMSLNRGGMFVAQLPPESDWHYAGKDVTQGDPKTPIFWYKPKDSTTYRVIYSDLTISDVSAENLPKEKPGRN